MFGKRGTREAKVAPAPAPQPAVTEQVNNSAEHAFDTESDIDLAPAQVDSSDPFAEPEDVFETPPEPEPQTEPLEPKTPQEPTGNVGFGQSGPQPAAARPSTLDLVAGTATAVSAAANERLAEIKVTVFNDLLEAVDLAEISRLESDAVREEITDMVAEIISMRNLVLTVQEQNQVDRKSVV